MFDVGIRGSASLVHGESIAGRAKVERLETATGWGFEPRAELHGSVPGRCASDS